MLKPDSTLRSLASGTCIDEPRDLRADHPQFQPIREQKGLFRGVHQEGSRQRFLVRKPNVQKKVEITLSYKTNRQVSTALLFI